MKLLSLNLANYNDHKNWGTRKKLIAAEIIRIKPDLIAFQENRFDPQHESSEKTYQSMAEQVFSELLKENFFTDFDYVHFPLQYYPINKKVVSHIKHIFWEGLAILSKYRIEETRMRKQQMNEDNPDKNQRGTLTVDLLINGKIVSLNNLHCTYDSKFLEPELSDRIKWIGKRSYQILVGDFNAEISNKAFTAMIDYTDVGPKGFSFPTSEPVIRIDLCFVSKDLKDKVKTATQIFLEPENGVFPSDHFGQLIEFDL